MHVSVVVLIFSASEQAFDGATEACNEVRLKVELSSTGFSAAPPANYINLQMSRESRYIFLVFLSCLRRGLWIGCSQGRRSDRSPSKSERTSHGRQPLGFMKSCIEERVLVRVCNRDFPVRSRVVFRFSFDLPGHRTASFSLLSFLRAVYTCLLLTRICVLKWSPRDCWNRRFWNDRLFTLDWYLYRW